MVEMLGGEGFDVIIEHLANINLGHDVQMLKNGARIMVVGCRGSVNINPRKYSLYYLLRIVHYFFKRNDDWSSCFLYEKLCLQQFKHKNVDAQKIILVIFNPSKSQLAFIIVKRSITQNWVVIRIRGQISNVQYRENWRNNLIA